MRQDYKLGPGKEATLKETGHKQHGVSPMIPAHTSEHLGFILWDHKCVIHRYIEPAK